MQVYSVRDAKPDEQRELTRLGYDEAFIDRAMPGLTVTLPLITGGLRPGGPTGVRRSRWRHARDGHLGLVDVIVTDGLTGNIVLKVAEGTAKQVAAYLRDSFTSSFAAKLGVGFARRGLKALRERMDPRQHNGAIFLGLQGLVVKSHGGSDTMGFANAIAIAHDAVTADLARSITSDLPRLSKY